jgi:hypothetical protein
MSFTPGNLSIFETEMKKIAGALLAATTVTLHGGGTVSVRMFVGMRRSTERDMTGGVGQETQVATIDADDWDTKAGRPPQKGDVLTLGDGRRFMIEDAHVTTAGGNTMFYKARLRGR